MMSSAQQAASPQQQQPAAGYQAASLSAQGAPSQQATPSFNKVFQLNRQLILTTRKLETGPLENYTHMATLIHKMNLLLLELDSIPQLKNTLQLIFSQKLLNTIVDFVMNTDNFANFGLRFLEILSIEYAEKVAKSEIVGILGGLLRTNDYETVAQGLSFLSVLCDCAAIHKSQEVFSLKDVLNKRLLVLIMRVVFKTPEIEYLHYALQIVDHALTMKELRAVVCSEDLRTCLDGYDGTEEQLPYHLFLKNHVEKMSEIVSIGKLHKKVTQQRREIEFWAKAIGKSPDKTAKATAQ